MVGAPSREETEMKYPIFVALLLSAAIALPVSAQQQNSSAGQKSATADQAAQPSQSTTASHREPLRDSSTGDFWDADEPGAAALIFHPFASKGYVRRHTAPIRDRVNELEELSATNSQSGKDVDARAQRGIQLASDKVNEADQHAADASNKSVLANQTASTVNSRLPRVETVVGGLDQYKAGTQTVIRFHAGQNVLSKDAKQALDEMAAHLKDQHGYVVEVHGYSSGRGQAGIASSRRMADSVVRYLVLNHEVPAYRVYVVGMGNAAGAGEDQPTAKHTDNRVEVSVMKNSLDQWAAASASGADTTPAPK